MVDVENIYDCLGQMGSIDDFETEEEIREYFTVENMIHMFSESVYSTEELAGMADYVINNIWKMSDNMKNMKITNEVKRKLQTLVEEMGLDYVQIIFSLENKGYFRYDEDYSDYEQGNSCDGGRYGYWINAHLLKDKEGFYLELEKRTTCDAFDFCSSCGSFNSHGAECEPIKIAL